MDEKKPQHQGGLNLTEQQKQTVRSLRRQISCHSTGSSTTGGPYKLCDRLYFEFIETMYGNIENPRIIVLDCDRYSH